jgi:hypothetical protein
VVSTVSDNKHLFDEFLLPEQNLKKLSFCSHKQRQFQEWLEDLPVTQTKHVSVLLYKLLPELNHLAISGSQRLGLMNAVRPYVHRCINGLADDFLKQPLSMTDNMTKIAAIAQALQRHICDGYMLVIHQLRQTNKLSPTAMEELSLAIYYAIHGLGQLLYRGYQLYIPRPPKLWKKLNTLYQLSVDYGFKNKEIPDNLLESRDGMSCQQAYFRTLILGCSHLNQLRQVDILHIYNALEQWAAIANFPPAREDEHSLYWVNIEADDGPFYKTRYNGPPSSKLHAVDLQNLVELLHTHESHTSKAGVIEIPNYFRQSLLAHLMTCWQEKKERRQSRQQANIELEICIGLKAAHNQLLEGQAFDEFIDSSKESSNESITLDGGMSPFTEGFQTSRQSLTGSGERQQPIGHVIATDTSDDGYCLRWSENAPSQVKSGEIVLLRKPGETQWQAGTIRWAQRLNHSTYVGVQLLPGYAEASAASTTLDNGSSTPFFRTLLIKGPEAEGSSSLLTPSIPFAPQQNIQLQLQGDCSEAKLTSLLLSSGSISQYSYDRL